MRAKGAGEWIHLLLSGSLWLKVVPTETFISWASILEEALKETQIQTLTGQSRHVESPGLDQRQL